MGDSIFSDGKYGCVYHSVAPHDATLIQSTCYYHCALLLRYLFSVILQGAVSMEEEESMAKILMYIPYEMLIETDGGPDHAIRTLHKKLVIFYLFLVARVDKIIVVRGFPCI